MKIEISIKSAVDTARVQQALMTLLPELAQGKEFDCIIEQHKEKRSINANNYSWKLQGEIAKVLNRSIDDIHNDMVLQYGVVETYSILKEAFDSAVRMFDYYRIIGESEVKGKTFVHVRAGVGTHLYDTAEMSKFIDGVVAEAQNLDIETKTPLEIEEMKNLWEKGER